MASHEDYEYSAFRCAFCSALNPARKLRPIAPRLQMGDESLGVAALSTGTASGKEASSSSTSTSEKDSGMTENFTKIHRFFKPNFVFRIRLGRGKS